MFFGETQGKQFIVFIVKQMQTPKVSYQANGNLERHIKQQAKQAYTKLYVKKKKKKYIL